MSNWKNEFCGGEKPCEWWKWSKGVGGITGSCHKGPVSYTKNPEHPACGKWKEADNEGA